jgi:hypothetical protein
VERKTLFLHPQLTANRTEFKIMTSGGAVFTAVEDDLKMEFIP